MIPVEDNETKSFELNSLDELNKLKFRIK